jgi:hypothetical protein
MSSFDAFIDSLADEVIETRTSSNEKRYPCGQCMGTGNYQGVRIHQDKQHCFACKGKGYFKTDPRKLQQRRRQAQQKKLEKIEAAQQVNIDSGLLPALQGMTDWNDFARSLVDQHYAGRPWSEAQVASAAKMVAKIEERRAAKAAEREAQAAAVDLSAIERMFETALASGYKKPSYRANGLRIKPGRNDALYVLNEERMEEGQFGPQPGYEGKIVDGKFYRVRATAETTTERLLTIAADPRGEAVRHGQRTGRCSCCGRELTKHASIEAGIGPICAEKWGL